MADKGKFAQWNHLVGVRQANIIDFHDPTAALPVNPATGDRYIATATANGWTTKRIYQWNGASWDETPPVLNMQAKLTDKSAEYWYDGADWVVISIAMRSGRNVYLSDTPAPRAAEWNGTGQNQHTIRRGRAAWAKARA